MSLQDLDSLINLLKSDPELRQKLTGCGTVAEASELLRDSGYSLSEQELLSLRSNVQVQGLSDTDLEAVAGGAGDKNSNAETCRNQGCQGR
jgi:predicted ribosomally synthesized peptide with nif11-like leader